MKDPHCTSNCTSEGPWEGLGLEGLGTGVPLKDTSLVSLGPGQGAPQVVERIQAGGRVGREDHKSVPRLPLGELEGGTWKDHSQHVGVISSVCQNQCTSLMVLPCAQLCASCHHFLQMFTRSSRPATWQQPYLFLFISYEFELFCT